MQPGRYARLTEDVPFKKAFATEDDKELLITLLNIFLAKKLALPIKDVFIKNPYIPGKTKFNRDAILDIHCVDEAGSKFIVEMQVNPQKHFFKRAIFYLSLSVANSGKKIKNWDFNFPNTYSLSFLDFDPDFGKKCYDIVQYFSLHNDDHPEIKCDYIRFAFVILPRFKKSLEECKSLQDKLIFSLCHAHEFKKKPPELNGRFFDRLFHIAEISNLLPMEYDEYISRFMARNDRYAQMEYAKEKGLEAGVLKVAKNMLAKGFSVASIVKATNLSREQVKALG